MKMNELLAENESLKRQITILSKQKDSEKNTEAITQYKEKIRSLKKSIKDLKNEKVSLTDKISELENDKSLKEKDTQILNEAVANLQQQLTVLSDIHAKTIAEVGSLQAEQQALKEKESQLQIIQTELSRLQQVEKFCNEKTDQADALQAELEQHKQLLIEVRAEASKDVADYQNQYVKLSEEMEMMRKGLLAELEAHREQTGSEIASLQAQKTGLSSQITQLTEKLNLVAKHLERQLNEKKKIAYQYDTSVKEYQAYKVKSEKEVHDLVVLMQKMAAELDAGKTTHPTQENQLSSIIKDKPGSQEASSTVEKQLQQQVTELQNHLSMLDEINKNQTRQLAAISTRMERINHVLATPLGRVFSQLFGLKN